MFAIKQLAIESVDLASPPCPWDIQGVNKNISICHAMFPRAAPECVAASHGAGAAIMVIDRAYSHQPGHVSRVWQSRGAATFPSLSRCHPLVSSFDSYDLLLLHSPPVIRHASYVWRCSIILNNTLWMCILLQVHLNKLPPHLILWGLSTKIFTGR